MAKGRDIPALTAAAVVAAFGATGLLARWIAPYPITIDMQAPAAARLQPPSAAHLFGTDASARDVLSLVMHGAGVSLGVALLSVAVIVAVGVIWGAVAGMAPPSVDRWMMRLVDAVLATPRLLIVLALVAFTTRMSPATLALLLGFTGWPPMSRVVRARMRELAATDYVAAARALGTPTGRIVIRHLIPATIPVVAVTALTAVAAVIPLEAALSFFGAGIAPPTPSWGLLLLDASARPLEAWWMILFPTLAIAATLMSVNILAERLQPRVPGTAGAR